MNKFLYFRTVDDEANDGVTGLKTNAPSSFMFPADTLTAMQPTADATLRLYFKPALQNGNDASVLRDTVDLNVNEGDHFEVMSAISDAISNPSRGHSDGFITVCDAVTTTDSAISALADLAVGGTFIHSSVSACAITVQSPSAGIGVHEHYEVVDITAAATADDDVLDPLSIYIPAQATIVEASITAVELSSTGAASCSLFVHSGAQVHNAGIAGTEIIGADTSGDHSLPDTDLNFGSGDILSDTITGGTLISHESPLDRSTAVSHFALCGKESGMSNAGSAKIGVYLKWYGPAAVAA